MLAVFATMFEQKLLEKYDRRGSDAARREFFMEILYKNIAIIAIQHGKFVFLTPLSIFPILLGEIHSSPSGKFSYTY